MLHKYNKYVMRLYIFRDVFKELWIEYLWKKGYHSTL